MLGGLQYRYDGAGNLLEREDSDGAITRYDYYDSEYEIKGLVEQKTDPRGKVTKYVYDFFGNLIRITNVANHVIAEYGYDVRGRMTRAIDARGNLTKYDYDVKDRLRKTTYADGSIEERIYNLADKLTESIDARSLSEN